LFVVEFVPLEFCEMWLTSATEDGSPLPVGRRCAISSVVRFIFVKVQFIFIFVFVKVQVIWFRVPGDWHIRVEERAHAHQAQAWSVWAEIASVTARWLRFRQGDVDWRFACGQ
jgi:hypothetical protein